MAPERSRAKRLLPVAGGETSYIIWLRIYTRGSKTCAYVCLRSSTPFETTSDVHIRVRTNELGAKLFILYGEYCRARLFLTPLSERDITFTFVSSPRTFPRTLTIGTDDDYAKLRSRGFLIDRPYRVRRVLSTYFENSIRQSVRIWKIIAVRIRLHGREIGEDVYYGSFFFFVFLFTVSVRMFVLARPDGREIDK